MIIIPPDPVACQVEALQAGTVFKHAGMKLAEVRRLDRHVDQALSAFQYLK